ncbi:hypothetical protein ABZP36_029623 [Zizania latifolia]
MGVPCRDQTVPSRASDRTERTQPIRLTMYDERERLRLHQPAPSPYAAGELSRPRRAAVLICLFRGSGGELRVLLTKRSSSLSTHSGEVSLPGGKAEEGDADDAATALREAKEEIGLDSALVTVVASLEHFLSKHLLVVVPVVGILSDVQAFKPVLNADEVDNIFDVPLEMFLKDEKRRSEEREWMGQELTIHYFNYEKGSEKYVIWGLTAGILIHTASVVYQRPPDFPERRTGEEGAGTDIEALIRRLRLYQPPPSPYTAAGLSTATTPAAAGELFRPRRAAVLVCLFRGGAGELRVVLTKRSSSLSTHSGEVALPGGKAEEGDADDAATALREAKEEIGLDPSLVTVVASLEHFLSKHLLVVVPIVGILSDIEAFKPVLNVDEVDDIFDVQLEMFLKDENRTSEEHEKMGQLFTIHYFNYEKGNQKYLIWGLTARILIHAASVVYQRPPDFPERRVQFNLPKY